MPCTNMPCKNILKRSKPEPPMTMENGCNDSKPNDMRNTGPPQRLHPPRVVTIPPPRRPPMFHHHRHRRRCRPPARNRPPPYNNTNNLLPARTIRVHSFPCRPPLWETFHIHPPPPAVEVVQRPWFVPIPVLRRAVPLAAAATMRPIHRRRPAI